MHLLYISLFQFYTTVLTNKHVRQLFHNRSLNLFLYSHPVQHPEYKHAIMLFLRSIDYLRLIDLINYLSIEIHVALNKRFDFCVIVPIDNRHLNGRAGGGQTIEEG